MNQKIVYVGVDVDDARYHGSALNKDTGESLSFRCRPTLRGLLMHLAKVRKHFPKHLIKVAYEASYVGFSLQRDLADRGYYCDVVAPTSIPRQGGKAIKTDRIDADQLAQFYANDLLTLVQVPEKEMEQDRDLMRSRQNLLMQREQVRRYLGALLRRNGLHYKAETQARTHWTKQHYGWLERTIQAQSGSLRVTLELLYRQLQGLNQLMADYNQHIEDLATT